jgi:hypothetical protein
MRQREGRTAWRGGCDEMCDCSMKRRRRRGVWAHVVLAPSCVWWKSPRPSSEGRMRGDSKMIERIWKRRRRRRRRRMWWRV